MIFFSSESSIGCDMKNTGDFVHAEELVDHLDYLEVDRALVYHRGALDVAPLSRNMELTEECAKYSDRLFPAFAITPSDRCEYDHLNWLKQQAEAGHRAFIMNQWPAFSFRQYEFLLEELLPYTPIIFTDPRYSLDTRTADGLEYLAKRFPSVVFIIFEGLFSCIIDLMERCPNINSVISQQQIRDALELIRDKFGVDRLFYGFHFKSNYGASIGALMHSSLTTQEKELVAHGNLERLLKLAPLKKKLAKSNDWTDKPLWKCFKEGKKLKNVSIYDAHSHEFSNPGTFIRDNSSTELLKKTVARMDSLGITAMLMTPGEALWGDPILPANRFLEKIRHFPGRFFAYFVYNPHFAHDITPEFLDSYFSNHECVGFKLLPQYWEIPLDDPGYIPVWRYAEEHRLPVLIHTWGDAIALKTIVPTYPHAKFILGHSGGSTAQGRKEVEEIGSVAPNTFFEFCATFCCQFPFEEIIRKFGSARVLFGSDANIHNQAFELAGYLSLPLPDSELIPGLAENIIRILNEKLQGAASL